MYPISTSFFIFYKYNISRKFTNINKSNYSIYTIENLIRFAKLF